MIFYSKLTGGINVGFIVDGNMFGRIVEFLYVIFYALNLLCNCLQ